LGGGGGRNEIIFSHQKNFFATIFLKRKHAMSGLEVKICSLFTRNKILYREGIFTEE
jgi:hypothetical protein